VGASDETGSEVAARPVFPADLIGSMYELLGIDPDGRMPNRRGMAIKVLPTAEPGEQRSGRLTEIM